MSISSIDLVALFTATACARAGWPREWCARFAPKRLGTNVLDAAPVPADTCTAHNRVEARRAPGPEGPASATLAAIAARAHAMKYVELSDTQRKQCRSRNDSATKHLVVRCGSRAGRDVRQARSESTDL